MFDWRTCLSTFLNEEQVEDFAVVGHEGHRCVWAAKPGGLLASISPQEVEVIVEEDREILLRTGLTIAGIRCCVIRDNLFLPGDSLMDLITKGNNNRPICIGRTPTTLVFLMGKAGPYGGIMNKKVYDIIRNMESI
ncbi:profilin-3 [Gastrophryne carolinensis]